MARRRRSIQGLLFVVLLALLAACSEVSAPPVGTEPSEQRTGDTFIVVLDPEFASGSHAANKSRAAEIARDLGLTPRHTYGTALFGFSAVIPEGRLNGIERDPRVLYIERDAPVSIPDPQPAAPPCHVTNTCEGDGGGSTGEVLPWGVDRVDADLNENEAAGVHVYVLDTGIDADHPDLVTNLGKGYAVESCKGGKCLAAWDDDHGHGTHVAGTVGAIDNDADVLGVASQVTLHSVKVLSKSGMGSRSGVIAGIDWIANEVDTADAPAVANMSLGGSGSKSGTCASSGFTGQDSYHNSICNAARVGVVFVVAAGNDGADAENFVPAAYDDAVLTVSATSRDTSGSDSFTSWSNWGNNEASWGSLLVVSAPVTLAAPGADILSTKLGGGTTTMSGTSMASPHVAGAAALYLKSNAQSADFTAFTNTREGLLRKVENADSFKGNTPSAPHNEDFLDAETL